MRVSLESRVLDTDVGSVGKRRVKKKDFKNKVKKYISKRKRQSAMARALGEA